MVSKCGSNTTRSQNFICAKVSFESPWLCWTFQINQLMMTRECKCKHFTISNFSKRRWVWVPDWDQIVLFYWCISTSTDVMSPVTTDNTSNWTPVKVTTPPKHPWVLVSAPNKTPLLLESNQSAKRPEPKEPPAQKTHGMYLIHCPCLSKCSPYLLGISGNLCVCSDVTRYDVLHQFVCSIYGLQKGLLTFGFSPAWQFLETNERFIVAVNRVDVKKTSCCEDMRLFLCTKVHSSPMCVPALCTWSKRMALR